MKGDRLRSVRVITDKVELCVILLFNRKQEDHVDLHFSPFHQLWMHQISLQNTVFNKIDLLIYSL